MGLVSTTVERLVDPAQFQLLPTGAGRVLDVGCGARKHPGAIGLDISADTDADVVHDLDRFPYPFDDNTFDQVLMQDVIEHVERPYAVVAELARICRPGARVQLRTPHFSSVLAYSDPTHRHFFSRHAILGLAEPGFAHYTETRMRVVSVTLDFWAPFRVLGIAALANRQPELYERYFAFRFPAMNIRADFEVLK